MLQKNMRKRSVISALLFIFALFPQLVSAVGVSPSMVVVENVANGISLTRSVNITRTDVASLGYFTVQAMGDGARYIELTKKEFYIPAGKKSGEYFFNIKPVGAQNGDHEAKLLFTQQAPPSVNKAGGSTVAVRSGVLATVQFTITDREVKKIVINSVTVSDTELGLPLMVTYWGENEGNVDLRPTKIVAKINDRTDPTHVIESVVQSSDIELIAPFERKMISVSFNEPLSLGEYKINIDFYVDNEVIYSVEGLDFQVLPQGTLKQTAEFKSFISSASRVRPNELVKFDALVKNSGEIGLQPTLYVEIKQGDKLVDLLKSDKKILYKNQEAVLFVTFRPQEEGEYTADAYIEYGTKQSEHKVVAFTVSQNATATNGVSAKKYLIGGVLLLAAVVIWLMKKFLLKA